MLLYLLVQTERLIHLLIHEGTAISVGSECHFKLAQIWQAVFNELEVVWIARRLSFLPDLQEGVR